MKTLQQLKVSELKAICDKHRILYSKRIKKAELIALIKAYKAFNSVIAKVEEEVKIPLYHYTMGRIGEFVKEEWDRKTKEIGGHFSTKPFEPDYLAQLSYF
jgi:hypothetical protein